MTTVRDLIRVLEALADRYGDETEVVTKYYEQLAEATGFEAGWDLGVEYIPGGRWRGIESSGYKITVGS